MQEWLGPIDPDPTPYPSFGRILSTVGDSPQARSSSPWSLLFPSIGEKERTLGTRLCKLLVTVLTYFSFNRDSCFLIRFILYRCSLFLFSCGFVIVVSSLSNEITGRLFAQSATSFWLFFRFSCRVFIFNRFVFALCSQPQTNLPTSPCVYSNYYFYSFCDVLFPETTFRFLRKLCRVFIGCRLKLFKKKTPDASEISTSSSVKPLTLPDDIRWMNYSNTIKTVDIIVLRDLLD